MDLLLWITDFRSSSLSEPIQAPPNRSKKAWVSLLWFSISSCVSMSFVAKANVAQT